MTMWVVITGVMRIFVGVIRIKRVVMTGGVGKWGNQWS